MGELRDLLALQLAGVSRSKLLHLFSGDQGLELGLEQPDSLYTSYSVELDHYRAEADRVLDDCQRLGIALHPFYSDAYPSSLKRLGASRPLILYSLGAVRLLHTASIVCVVGTRYPDAEGAHIAYQLGYTEARKGACVLSGLAIGCDTEAHRGALSGGGVCIAVVATGLDQTYPEQNKVLQQQLLSHGGLVLSEYPPGVDVAPHRLIARDRLQAVLAQRVLLAQCPLRSGTLYTAYAAHRYGIPLYAHRFSLLYAQNAGNDKLLSMGIARPMSELPVSLPYVSTPE